MVMHTWPTEIPSNIRITMDGVPIPSTDWCVTFCIEQRDIDRVRETGVAESNYGHISYPGVKVLIERI